MRGAGGLRRRDCERQREAWQRGAAWGRERRPAIGARPTTTRRLARRPAESHLSRRAPSQQAHSPQLYLPLLLALVFRRARKTHNSISCCPPPRVNLSSLNPPVLFRHTSANRQISPHHARVAFRRCCCCAPARHQRGPPRRPAGAPPRTLGEDGAAEAPAPLLAPPRPRRRPPQLSPSRRPQRQPMPTRTNLRHLRRQEPQRRRRTLACPRASSRC